MSAEGRKMSDTSLIRRRRDDTTGSMEVLSPDFSSSVQEDYNLSIEVDDYETDSDLNSEECWDSEGEIHMDKYAGRQKDVDKPTAQHGQGVGLEIGRELVPFQNDDGVDVDSDEERDIMKEIRAEIENQVRADMKDELAVYQKKLEQLEHDGAGETTHRDDQGEEKETDPKLKAAILKMKKLDRILNKKIKKEKEVKRNRFLLQKRLREELAQIKPDGRDDTKEVKANMEKFLMLALPPSHNEGVDLAEEEVRPITPVFHTQLNEKDFEDRRNRDVAADRGRGRSTNSSAGSSTTRENQNDDEKLKQKNHKKRTKDFIKRNKQLASDADNPIPMTDDEKKRINDLLGDLDSIPDLPDNMEADHMTSSAWTSENPFQLSVHSGEGFLPEPDEKCSLERIDSQLRTLLPAEEFVAFRVSNYTPDRQRLMATQATILNGSEAEFDRLGEQALQEKRDERDLQTRLRRIEEELSRLHNPAFDIELDTPGLSEEGLHNLIDQCVYSLSRSSVLTSHSGQDTPGSECSSSRLSLLENPPKLDQDVLQRLLTEARGSVHSHRSTNDRDSVNDVRNHHFTKELGIETITSDTWDVFNSVELSDDDTPVPEQDSSHRVSNLSRGSESSRLGGKIEETRNLSSSREEDMSRFRTDTPLSIHSYRESENFDVASSRASSVNRNSRTPFLPEISHSPCLVSQGATATNVRLYDPAETNSDRNGRSVNPDTGSRGQSEMSVPRPPTSERPQNNRSRSITSSSQDS